MTDNEVGKMMSQVANAIRNTEDAHPGKIHVGTLRGSVAKRVVLMLLRKYDIKPHVGVPDKEQ